MLCTCTKLLCLIIVIAYLKSGGKNGVAAAECGRCGECGCVPNDAVKTGQGWACVCNSSYCDVIAPPTTLPRGQFHVYSTSKARPGFTHTNGTFGPVTYGPRNQGDVVITVDASLRYQKILGFGGAITDSVGAIFNLLPKGAQEKFIESYFGQNGIEYSFLRVPIGSTDFSLRKYTLNDVPYDVDMKHFNLTTESFIYQIPMIKRAQLVSRREVKLLASTWLVPAWMKQNWEENNVEGWLNPRYYDALTEYHAKFIEAYRAEGLDLWGVTGGNEVILFTLISFSLMPMSKRLNATCMTADTQRDWLRHVRPRIGKDVKFITLDDTRLFVNYWMKRMELDKQVIEEIDGVGLHWYMDWVVSPTVLDKFHHRYPEKLILYTESSINIGFSETPVVLGSWNRAEFYIQNIIENINHWTHAYMDWNIALNTMGGPTLNLLLDAPVLINETSGEFYKQPMFYAMGHFSKFIQPGAERIGLQVQTNQKDNQRSKYRENILQQAKDSDELAKSIFPPPQVPPVVMGLAADNPDGSRTVILFNPKNTSELVMVQDSEVGNISTRIEENSIYSFIYWPSCL